MNRTRPSLLAVAALLALTGCGDGRGGPSERKEAPSAAPFGFELALASAANAANPEPAGTAPAADPAPLIALTPEELAARLKVGNVRLIDVRTDAEVAEGMIPGAEHIALDRFDPASLDLSDGREVVLYCRSGRRSAMAGEKLAEVTGKPVEHLEGGVLAWQQAGQPLAPR